MRRIRGVASAVHACIYMQGAQEKRRQRFVGAEKSQNSDARIQLSEPLLRKKLLNLRINIKSRDPTELLATLNKIDLSMK